MKNTVILLGNLGKDPEGGKTRNGKDSARFSVATRSSRKDQDGKYGTEWFNVQAYGPTADYVLQYCAKGAKVYVEGELQSYQSEKYGKQYSVLANTVKGIVTERPQVKGGQQTLASEPDVPW